MPVVAPIGQANTPPEGGATEGTVSLEGVSNPNTSSTRSKPDVQPTGPRRSKRSNKGQYSSIRYINSFFCQQ